MPTKPPGLPTKSQLARYYLICLVSVAYFHFRPSWNSKILLLLWAITPIPTLIFVHYIVTARSILSPDSPLPPKYTVYLGLLLIYLGDVARWVQTYLAVPRNASTDEIVCVNWSVPCVRNWATDHGMNPQICAIHFGLAFFLLSECEWVRPYLGMYMKPDRPLSERLEPSPRPFIMCYKPHEHYTDTMTGGQKVEVYLKEIGLSFMFVFVGMACLCWPVKGLANARSAGDGFFPIFNVFFTPRSAGLGWVDLMMQRPVRWLNRLLFWETVGMGEMAWGKWKGERRPTGTDEEKGEEKVGVENEEDALRACHQKQKTAPERERKPSGACKKARKTEVERRRGVPTHLWANFRESGDCENLGEWVEHTSNDMVSTAPRIPSSSIAI